MLVWLFTPPFCTRKYFKKFIPPSYLTKRPRHLKFGVDLTDPAKLVFQLIAWLDKVCIYRIIQQKQKKKQKNKTVFWNNRIMSKIFIHLRSWTLSQYDQVKSNPILFKLKKCSAFNTSESGIGRSFKVWDKNVRLSRYFLPPVLIDNC